MKLEKEVYIDNYYFDYSVNFIGKKDIIKLKPEELFTTEERIFINENLGKKVKLTLEIEEPILDDAERKYLSGVIRPFKDRVRYIVKSTNQLNHELICIYYDINNCTLLPVFKKGTMYKNMKLNKEYTLEELDL